MPQPAPAAPHWSSDKGYVRMMIRDLVTEVPLGLHLWERHPEKPQRIVINVELYAAPAGPIKGHSSIVDYDYIREAIRKQVLKPRAQGPIALWDGEPKRTSGDHDSIHDEV